jgi:hypothetical protein
MTGSKKSTIFHHQFHATLQSGPQEVGQNITESEIQECQRKAVREAIPKYYEESTQSGTCFLHPQQASVDKYGSNAEKRLYQLAEDLALHQIWEAVIPYS